MWRGFLAAQGPWPPRTAAALVQCEKGHGIARRHQYMLVPIKHIGFRSIRYLCPEVCMPKRLAADGIVRHKISGEITSEHRLAGSRKHASHT